LILKKIRDNIKLEGMEREKSKGTIEELDKVRAKNPAKNRDILNILRGTIRLVMSMGFSPAQAKAFLKNVDGSTSESLSYLFGGEADGRIITEIADKLSQESDS
jgi:hypothetical protein